MDDDDDYWNTSETKAKAFSFDDDVLSPQEILAIGQNQSSPGQGEDSLFSGTSTSSVKTVTLPVSSLVSNKVLELILLAQSGQEPKESQAPPEQSVAAHVQRLVLGRARRLPGPRGLAGKTRLLDAALAVGDGNAILTVVLFLVQTLNRRLVYELLSARPPALGHYVSFLQTEGKISELTDLLTMLGRSPDAAMQQFQHVVRQGGAADGLRRRAAGLLANHFQQPGVDAHQAKMVADFVKLLEWQKFSQKAVLENQSALRCLAYCCAHHWHEGAGNMMSPLTLCQRQQISPLQYDWVVLNVHARAGKWDIVESLFTKKDWLGRSTVSSHIPIETLLSRLSELRAGAPLLAACVARVAAAPERLRLAQAFKIHSVVIETYAKQKDRLALQNYKMALSPQSEEFFLVENTLRDHSIKWKN